MGILGVTLNSLVITLICLPVLAIAVLALYALALLPLKNIPAHEYAQAVRAPIWLVVLVSGSLVPLALLALAAAPPGSYPAGVYLTSKSLLRVDGYALWGCAVLGAVMAVATWVPAARRSLRDHSLGPSLLLLALLWCAQLLLFCVRLETLLAVWMALLAGTALLWAWVGRPRWQWEDMEPLAILGVAMLCGWSGLDWLQGLTHGAPLADAWSEILIAAPRAASGAMLLVMFGWLGPAVYLPWWLGKRREEAVQAWLPAALVLAVGGPLALARLFWAIFPSLDLGALVERLFLVRNLLTWLQAWGVLALVLGAGWLVINVWRQRRNPVMALRPLPLAISGLMLLGLVMALQTQTTAGVAGLVWLLMAWAGSITLTLTAGNMLDALTPSGNTERMIVTVCAWAGIGWLAVAALLGLVSGWSSLTAIHAPAALILFAVLVTLVCAGILLPRWLRDRYATVPYPGASWGILAPFCLALLLAILAMLAGLMGPVMEAIKRGLIPVN